MPTDKPAERLSLTELRQVAHTLLRVRRDVRSTFAANGYAIAADRAAQIALSWAERVMDRSLFIRALSAAAVREAARELDRCGEQLLREQAAIDNARTPQDGAR